MIVLVERIKMLSGWTYFLVLITMLTGCLRPYEEMSLLCNQAVDNGIPVYQARVKSTYPHPRVGVRRPFTEGLFFHNGILFESAGPKGEGGIFKYQLGDVENTAFFVNRSNIFPEGIATDGNQLVMLTEKAGHALRFNHFDQRSDPSRINFAGTGWGLTFDGVNFLRSDGTDRIYSHNRETFEVLKTIQVNFLGHTVEKINELEYIDGLIWANIWFGNYIIQISPETGEVVGVIDLSKIIELEPRLTDHSIANGIAYDPSTGEIVVTGKRWDGVYSISLELKDCGNF